MRSIPTSETRTHASITMPLSSTRSRTSIRLDPPDALSTGMSLLQSSTRRAAPGRGGAGEGLDLPLEQSDLLAQAVVLHLIAIAPGREVMVVLPPVQPDLLGLVDRADDEADAHREELDLGERHLDVAGDDETLVENAVQHVHQAARLIPSQLKFSSHQ